MAMRQQTTVRSTKPHQLGAQPTLPPQILQSPPSVFQSYAASEASAKVWKGNGSHLSIWLYIQKRLLIIVVQDLSGTKLSGNTC